MPAFAHVALPLPIPTPYTYAIPETLLDRVVPGARVVVPLRRREMVGIVVRSTVTTVNAKLRKLGINNLQVEEHNHDLQGNSKRPGQTLTEIACWESR